MQLSRKCLAIEQSVTLKIDAMAKEMKAKGLDVVGFGAGEPDFDTPAFIRDAAKEALDKGLTRYTPVGGTPELKKAVVNKLKCDNGLDYAPSGIVISCGAKHSLFNIMQALLNPGDEVLIGSPCWVSYPEMVKMADGVPVIVRGDKANAYKVTAAGYAAAVTPRTKAIIINSPNNPNGYVYTRGELAAIAELAVERDLAVVSDEIYEKLVYDGAEHVSIASLGPEIKKRTVIVNGVSKSYAMTGWRIGYAACEGELADVMTNFQSQSTSNPNSIAQYASAVALNSDGAEVDAMALTFGERRRYLLERISGIAGLSAAQPMGAFYVMLDISSLLGRSYKGARLNGSIDVADALLREKMVALVPGLAFYDDTLCRISYAAGMGQIEKGMDRIAEFVKELE